MIIQGDCREILPTLDLSESIVITDPPWPSGVHVDIEGAGAGAVALWESVVPLLSSARAVIVYQSQLDLPLAPIPGLKFQQMCWLKYIPPTYNGKRMRSASVAFVYGEPAMAVGRKCWSSETTAVSSPETRRQRKCGHPCPMSILHARWLVKEFAAGCRVVDPFVGSGTALVAAAEVGLDVLGIESDPRFVPIAERAIATAQRPIPGLELAEAT